MTSGKTKNRTKRQEVLAEIVDKFEEARLVKNKYRVVAKLIKRLYDIEIPEDKLAEICYDAIQADREWQIETAPYDRENKKILEQKKILELGYEVGYNQKYHE